MLDVKYVLAVSMRVNWILLNLIAGVYLDKLCKEHKT